MLVVHSLIKYRVDLGRLPLVIKSDIDININIIRQPTRAISNFLGPFDYVVKVKKEGLSSF